MISVFRQAAIMIASTVAVSSCVSPVLPDRSPVQAVAELRMEEFLNTSQAHSVSVAIVFQGEGFTAHSGSLDPHRSAPPSDASFYEVASITKTFTGTIAAQAVLEGRLSLDDDVRQYLEGDHPNLEFANEPIRVRHLLTHTSGLPANAKGMTEALSAFPPANGDGANWRLIYEANRNETRESFLEYLTEVELLAAPGTTFNYSNYGTNLTAHILERVYGRSYAELLEEIVFKPAGMNAATLSLRPEQEEHRALGFNEVGENIPRLPIADVLWGADGGVKATAHDMMNYLKWQLEQSSPAITESRQRLDQRDIGYWLGYFWWVIDTETGARSYRHDGGGAGVRNVLIVYPEDDLAIFAVTNKTTPELNQELTSMVQSIRSDMIH